MTQTFNPTLPPQEGPSGNNRFRVHMVSLGEGYSSAFGEGMNQKVQSWPLSWKGTASEVLPIRDFFDAHLGHRSFYWTPPYGTQGRYQVTEYELVPHSADNVTLSATFEQVFR